MDAKNIEMYGVSNREADRGHRQTVTDACNRQVACW